MADKQSTKPPAGTRDFLPDEIRRREYVIDVIRRVYESYGFEPLETPAFENIETLLGKYGEEGNKLIFKILKRGELEKSGEADLALRYDLTVPLARVVAQYQNELPKFFKRYQIQPVWRADRPAKGRFREFYQCDIDSLGSTSPIVEAEQLAAITDVLSALGFRDFVIRINHRGLLTALLKKVLQVSPPTFSEALVALDKLDKIGEDGVAAEFEQRNILQRSAAIEGLKRAAGFKPPTAGTAVTKLALEGLRKALNPDPPTDATKRAALEGLKRALDADPSESRSETARRAAPRGALGPVDGTAESDTSALSDLRQIIDLVSSTSAGEHIRFDPFLARGLSYYTGAIMEAAVPDLAGSLGGGGRYDNLIGMFLGRDIPACGFSLGLERIIVVMAERNMFPASVAAGGVDVLVTMWEDSGLRADAVKLAAQLRGAGLRVELYPEPDKIGKQFKYADDRHARFVAVQGENERAAGTVTIKNLATGTQESVARTEAPAFIVRTLNREPEREP